MDLSRLTEDQEACVRRVDGPLLICAGAGSGKTFTLTQRIAYALLHPDESGVADIDEVCAITFTEKAAGEIKARVKRTLRAEGMLEQANRVDGSWISTIHGMCARILRSYALELGIDPAFAVIDDTMRQDLLLQAINDAIADCNEIVGSRAYAHLFAEYPVQMAYGGGSVVGMVDELVSCAAQLADGFDAIELITDTTTLAGLTDDLRAAYAALLPSVEGTKRADAVLASLAAIDAFSERLASGAFENDEAAIAAFTKMYASCEMVAKPSKGDLVEPVLAFQLAYKEVAARLLLFMAGPAQRELLALAKDANARFMQAKRALAAMDNDDLLTQTLAALRSHPQIAGDVAQRFKLVMVDEFQDTSQLQVDLISYVAGENSCHLCTVGDSQQSIYRFRGADVNVYEAHKRAMRSEEVGAVYKELAKNFRSSADVLAFVNGIFGNPEVFGDSFMRLAPHEDRTGTWTGGDSRIRVVVTTRPAARGSGVTMADVRQAEARAIAQQFAELQASGMATGDMVILLGGMTHADVYAQAVREQGMKCIITGGSLFSSADDVQIVGDLVQAIYNPADTQALYSVLASELFGLSTDDLLCLASCLDGDGRRVRRRAIDAGLAQLGTDDFFDGWGASPSLAFAREVLERARGRLADHAFSEVVRRVLVESGWLARLQAEGPQGFARIGNLFKAVRLIESAEANGAGSIASVAAQIRVVLAANLKESPGTLNARVGDAVRIMTIHASKGLEFPVVAVAEYDQNPPSAGVLSMEAFPHEAYSVLRAKQLPDEVSVVKKRADEYFKTEAAQERLQALERVDEGFFAPGMRAIDASVALIARSRYEELHETYRKLYVALTRASEGLIVAVRQTLTTKGEVGFSSQGAIVAEALGLAGAAGEGEMLLDYGGSCPARVELIDVAAIVEAATEGIGQAAEPPMFLDPGVVIEDAAAGEFGNPLRSGVFSYSSLARMAHADEDDGEAVEAGSDGVGEPAASVEAAADAEIAANVEAAAEVEAMADAMGVEAAADTENLAAETAALRTSLDEEKATALGSAFHRAAQFAIETGCVPDSARLDTFARVYDVSEAQRTRLDAAVTRWFASDAYARAVASPSARAEVPFFVDVGGYRLEGEIDLLCTDAATSGHALVFDYKTGGSKAETAEALLAKHELQAQCYAYALLAEGFASVELHFARVEQPVGPDDNDPQSVDYSFRAADMDALRERIVARCEA